MQVKQLQRHPHQTYALVFDKEDEFMTELQTFAEEKRLSGSHLAAVGAFRQATLGFFDRTQMDYKEIAIAEQVEVLSLTGNIAANDGKPKIHAHVVLGKADGTAVGGHLLQATVWPTLELIVEESPVHMHRKSDPETGLALLELNNK
jgi:predicted DNA-binding protein with PD1-like motif